MNRDSIRFSSLRLASICLAALATVCSSLTASEATVKQAPSILSWPSGDASLVTFIEEPNLLVTVVPQQAGIQSDEQLQEALKLAANAKCAQVKFFRPESGLLIFSCGKVAKQHDSCAQLSKLVPHVGTILPTFTEETSADHCPLIIGRDAYYQGRPLSPPLLRVRLSELSESEAIAGKPLYCGKDKLVGFLSNRTLDQEQQAHAICSSTVLKHITELSRFGRTGSVRLGVLFHDKTTTPEVLAISPDSPAAAAGLQPNDVIVSLGEKAITSLDQLTQELQFLTAGSEISLRVLRGVEKRTIAITPALRPEAAGAE